VKKENEATRAAPFDLATLAKIRDSVHRTIQEGQAALLQREEEEARAQRERNEKWVREAKAILQRIPEMVRRAVRDGERKVIVVDKIRGLPWTGTQDGWALPVMRLSGAERIVADACVEMGFTVSVVGTHDGGGQDAWHQLVMTW